MRLLVCAAAVLTAASGHAAGQQLRTPWDLPANRAAVVSTLPEGGTPGGAERAADPTRWTNRAQLVDVGCDWYLNKFVKVYGGWEHAVFDAPVFSAGGTPAKSNDLFWLRTQVYF